MTTNSLVNMIILGAGDEPPVVGMGATMPMWTDRHAYTVVEAGPKRLVAQQDIATRVDGNGMSDAQSYTFAPNPAAPREVFTLRKNGRWVKEGESMRGGQRLSLGARSEYHDYSF